LFLVLVFLAMCSGGISRFQTLWLGVETLPVNDTIRAQFGINRKGGVLINKVYEHSPAETAGLRRGDVLVNVDNLPIYAARDVRTVLEGKSLRDSVPVIYIRDGAVFATRVVLGYRAPHASATSVRSVYRYDLTVADFVELLALGLVAGILSGMIGCGGGVLKVSLLIVLFGFEIFLAKVVSLVSCGFMSLSSSYRYVKQGRVDGAALKYLIPSSILGALAGAGVSILVDRHVLEVTLGVFLIYAALDGAYQIYGERRVKGNRRPDREDGEAANAAQWEAGDRSVLVFAGIPLGVFSAVLGITGGVIGTPLQRALYRAPIRTCIANTLVTVVFVSFLGGGVLLVEGLIRDYFSFRTFVKVLLAIMPGSLIGGQIGARLNEELPTDYIKGVYAIVVLYVAYRILAAV
ncbi:MAG TPA: TSUP family transporter, partial [Candidatus Hydrogenedentes bacterium]|nr:TSUP family transporter [Candidatus Hydrogenedentota bacterium]